MKFKFEFLFSFENDDLSMADDNLTDNEEVAMKENDELRSSRANPMTKTQFDNLFDDSGRLIREHELRRAIFKGMHCIKFFTQNKKWNIM